MEHKRALGYVRVSTREQAEHGVSLDAQERAIRAYADGLGIDLVAVHRDAGFSGASMERPALARMIETAQAGGISAVVVWKLDRVSRKQRDLWNLIDGTLEPAGVALKSVSESFDTASPSGRAMLGMLAVFAAMERETIGERTRAGMAQVKREGRHVGRVPFGYRLAEGEKPGTLESNAAEQGIISLARSLREAGHSLRQTATLLNTGGHRGRNGKPFTHQSLGYILAAA